MKKLLVLVMVFALLVPVIYTGCEDESYIGATMEAYQKAEIPSSITNWGQTGAGKAQAGGKINNDGSETIDKAVITVKYYDASGKVIAENTAEALNIKPGQSADWQTYEVTGGIQAARCEISSVRTYKKSE